MLYFHAPPLSAAHAWVTMVATVAICCYCSLVFGVSRCCCSLFPAVILPVLRPKSEDFCGEGGWLRCFFRCNNSENSGAAICHLVHRDNYYPRDRHGRARPVGL